MMPNSLFIEHHVNGLAFYINGDLQFDTVDEALYHEYLVIPTIALAVKRFPQDRLRVLICGGGDGLAARDALRFEQVYHIDLVDYDPEVLELAQTVFKPFNQSSLESDRLTVQVQEAFEFISTIPDNFYHVIICDFTYPTHPENTSIYSREWFQQLNRTLISSGMISTNGVSPENCTTGFWCLYQTLLSAELQAKPLQLSLPSFQAHGYGNWGFFLASPVSITRFELEDIKLPDHLKVLNSSKLLQAFLFAETIANVRHDVTIHTLGCPQLFYYLLNPLNELQNTDTKNAEIDFIEICESSNNLIGNHDLLKLESIAQVWMQTISQNQDVSNHHLNINKLLPVQHRYHTPKMTQDWLAYLQHLLSEIDFSQLLNCLLERSQEIPPRIAQDLKQLRSGKTLQNLPPKATEFIMLLSITLLMANLVTPDAVFAKGSGSSSSYDDNTSADNRFWGFILLLSGGFWLLNIYNRSKDQ